MTPARTVPGRRARARRPGRRPTPSHSGRSPSSSRAIHRQCGRRIKGRSSPCRVSEVRPAPLSLVIRCRSCNPGPSESVTITPAVRRPGCRRVGEHLKAERASGRDHLVRAAGRAGDSDDCVAMCERPVCERVEDRRGPRRLDDRGGDDEQPGDRSGVMQALDQSERDMSDRRDHERGPGGDRRGRHDPSERAEHGGLARPVEV